MAINFPEGSQDLPCKVLQVVSLTYTTAFTQTVTSTATDISNFSQSITKKSSTSDILVMANMNFSHTASYARFGIRLKRGSDIICVGTSTGNRLAVTVAPTAGTHDGYGPPNWHISYLDNNTSSGTYTYKFDIFDQDNASQTLYFNRGVTDDNSDSYHRTASTLTLMEIEP